MKQVSLHFLNQEAKTCKPAQLENSSSRLSGLKYPETRDHSSNGQSNAREKLTSLISPSANPVAGVARVDSEHVTNVEIYLSRRERLFV